MDFQLPELGEGVYEAELVSWLVGPTQVVKRGQALMEVLTDKATMEVPSPFVGTVNSLLAKPGNKIKVGEAVLSYQPQATAGTESGNGEHAPEKKTVQVLAQPTAPRIPQDVSAARRSAAAVSTTLGVKAAPSIRQLARRMGIDLATIDGSGPGGRILIEDLAAQLQSAGPAKRTALPEEHPEYGRPGLVIPFQGVRRKIAEHLVLSKRTIPHYSVIDECDVTELVRLRSSLKETFQKAGVKLTILAFIVRAVVAALKEIPIANSTLDEEKSEILVHPHYHIGVAVATTTGLIVPVIHDADQKDVAAIASELDRLSSAARNSKIHLDDLRGGTFTVTSIGGIGGLISTPIIHQPQVGILGIGKAVKRPMYDSAGNLRPADMLYISLSFDHRVVDGAVGAAFGTTLKRHLENPARLLLPERLRG